MFVFGVDLIDENCSLLARPSALFC